MLLTIDTGNSNITFGIFNGNRLLFCSRMETEKFKTGEQYAAEMYTIAQLHEADITKCTGAIVSCVVPELNASLDLAVECLTGSHPLFIGPGVKTNLNIRIDNPAQLGADLVAGAVGALSKYRMPCIIVDLGTATKLSVLDMSGAYRGCSISAGVALSLSALASGAAQLPSVPANVPISPIGTNTIASMQSGSILGTAAMIDGMCARLEEALGEKIATIVATGGLAAPIVSQMKTKAIYDPTLILDGLKVIYDKNIRKA